MSFTRLSFMAVMIAVTSPLAALADSATVDNEPLISEFADSGRMIVINGEAFYDPSDGEDLNAVEQVAQPYVESQPVTTYIAAPAAQQSNGWGAAPVVYATETVAPAEYTGVVYETVPLAPAN